MGQSSRSFSIFQERKKTKRTKDHEDAKDPKDKGLKEAFLNIYYVLGVLGVLGVLMVPFSKRFCFFVSQRGVEAYILRAHQLLVLWAFSLSQLYQRFLIGCRRYG